MKLKYVIYLLALLIPFKVLGADCDFKDVARYQALASNVKFNYEFVESSKTFNIIITNMPDELYFEITSSGEVFSSRTVGSSETVLYGYTSGSYRFRIVPYDPACYESTVGNGYVNLPYYNSYYNDPVCNGAENYKLCQKWNKVDLSYDDFVKNVEAYKKSLVKEEVTQVEETVEDDFLNKIIVGFLDNYVIILISIIVICSVLIVILSRKGKFDLR